MKINFFIGILKKMGEEIVVDIKPKENNQKIYLAWLAIAAFLALATFTGGFATGKSGKLPLSQGETATASAAHSGWSVLNGKTLSIEYPKDWKAEEHPQGEPDGAKITSAGGSVELWIAVSQPYQFSEEQKKKQVSKKEEKITVSGRSSFLTEFSYESGGSFLIIVTPASNQKPQVTFWAMAANEEYKKTVLDIINSFKTKI